MTIHVILKSASKWALELRQYVSDMKVGREKIYRFIIPFNWWEKIRVFHYDKHNLIHCCCFNFLYKCFIGIFQQFFISTDCAIYQAEKKQLFFCFNWNSFARIVDRTPDEIEKLSKKRFSVWWIAQIRVLIFTHFEKLLFDNYFPFLRIDDVIDFVAIIVVMYWYRLYYKMRNISLV